MSCARASATALSALPVSSQPVARVGHTAGPFRRALSAAVTALPRRESCQVPCRSNGAITLDIFHAPTPAAPIVVYLPPGPVVHSDPAEDEHIISLLRDSSSATIARIQYRASEHHPFPTPCHDVLSGYDWIRDHLLRDEFQRPFLSRLGVCGQLMGGSLATILALTECRLGESRVGAASINNPITDWVFPDELPRVDPAELPEPVASDETSFPANEDLASTNIVPEVQSILTKAGRPRKRKPRTPPQTPWQKYGDNPVLPTLTMLAQRNALFRRPEDYLDRFASPAHFFRSPHVQILQPIQDDLFASHQPGELHDAETQMALAHFASFDTLAKPATSTPPSLPTLSRCRAYARGYPPAGTNLSLPVWQITAGLRSPLYPQAAELTKMLRQSMARHRLKSRTGRSRWHDEAEKKEYAGYAEGRVVMGDEEGVGLWSEKDPGWEERVKKVGAWMKECLRPEFG